jgi:hypothetical protein
MNGWKKYSAYWWRRLGRIKQWHLGLAFVALLVLTGLALRQNNLEMVELRRQVMAADEGLDQDKVNSSAQILRDYVSQHMNANSGQIALQNLYNRAVEQALAQANTEIDASVYSKATDSCQPQLSQSGYQGYAACVAAAVGLSSAEIRTPEPPNPALYYLSFVSPKLSFDLAGVSLILTIGVFLVMMIRFLLAGLLGVICRQRADF